MIHAVFERRPHPARGVVFGTQCGETVSSGTFSRGQRAAETAAEVVRREVRSGDLGINQAPQVGFEPTTRRLTADCSTAELLRSVDGLEAPDLQTILASG